jgi:hypothetical protein
MRNNLLLWKTIGAEQGNFTKLLTKNYFYWSKDSKFSSLNIGDFIFIVDINSATFLFASYAGDSGLKVENDETTKLTTVYDKENDEIVEADGTRWEHFIKFKIIQKIDIESKDWLNSFKYQSTNGTLYLYKNLPNKKSGLNEFKPSKTVQKGELQNKLMELDLNEKAMESLQYSIDYLNNNTFEQAPPIVKKESIKKIENTSFNSSSFLDSCSNAHLTFSEELIIRYTASLATKPFVILSGLSGSGKTKLAQSFAQWICADNNQYCIVPVGADWTNREHLLGYENALDKGDYIMPENGALQLLIDANKKENKELPYFLILDEMNLSHVERYFADFLSIMESKDKFKLHNFSVSKSNVPNHIEWPKNLFVVGTVNIDETTYMFSPKVLDRANVIEFRVNENEIKQFLEKPKDIKMENLISLGANMAANFLEISLKETNGHKSETLNKTLVNFFKELKKTGAEFGYRTAMEIHRLYHQLSIINNTLTEDKKIDIVIIQKLLPKLHGSRRKLCPVLETLGKLCISSSLDIKKDVLEAKDEFLFFENEEVVYPNSLEKITRMYKSAVENGFASYAEA